MNRLLIGNRNIAQYQINLTNYKLFILGKVDVLVVTETKLDSTFPTSQLLIKCYSESYRFDRNRNVDGILIYTREDIPSKLLANHTIVKEFFVKLNLRKYKWLFFGSYHTPSQSDLHFFNHVKKVQISIANFMIYTSLLEMLGERSQNCVFRDFFSK